MELLIDGLRIHYTDSGTGREVLLLHGWGVDSSVMEPLRLHLAQTCRAVSVDLPGFGGSETPPGVWGVYEYADLVQHFIAALGLQRPVLLGHSFGGRLTIILGSRGAADQVILTDAAGIIPMHSLGWYVRVYSYKAAKKVLSWRPLQGLREPVLQLWLKRNPSTDYAQAQGVMRQIFVKVVNQDLQPLLPSISASTLLLWGERDTATPLHDGQLMEKLIPDAGLVVFENCGHYPFLDQPQRFYAVVDYFLTH